MASGFKPNGVPALVVSITIFVATLPSSSYYSRVYGVTSEKRIIFIVTSMSNPYILLAVEC
jgi:hypothetical protein